MPQKTDRTTNRIYNAYRQSEKDILSFEKEEKEQRRRLKKNKRGLSLAKGLFYFIEKAFLVFAWLWLKIRAFA